MSRKITYNCERLPANFSLFNPNGKYPMPKRDTYYWHLHNTTDDIIPNETILAFEKAMNIWQRAFDNLTPKGSYLHLKSTCNLAEADFVISFGGKEHLFPYWGNNQVSYRKCPYDFDGEGGVLAHAWTLEAPFPFGGQMHMDEAEEWARMHTRDKKDLLTVFLHEFGHNLGIAHSSVKDAMMYPSYTGEKQELHADDLAGLDAKLGRVKKIVYEKFYKPYEGKGECVVDRFGELPMFWQTILNKMYGKRWQ